MGGTQSRSLILLSKEITAECLPGSLTKEADFLSRTVKNSSRWKLNPKIFQMIYKQWEKPDVEPFASRILHQIPAYMSCRLDPVCKVRYAFQSSWTRMRSYVFPPFSLVGRVLSKVQRDQTTH